MDPAQRPATERRPRREVTFTPERWGRAYIALDAEPPGVVHQPAALVGPPAAGAGPPGRPPHGGRDGAAGAAPECGSAELTRETDVLDTWFSSALWPFATFGWPEQTADLAYFYPTNVLSTGRDIIFLWVARMIMMGLEFMHDVPFDDVYIHSVIQAPDGRRMSKSLGTGIDPLDMIDEHGADATRFGLLLMSSTQDVRFSDEKIAMGRGFANKLWNAARFVLLGSEGYAAERSEAGQVDRWITSRFQRCLATVEGGGGRLRLLRRRGRSLPLRVGRVLRLVPRDGQGAAVRRRRGAEGAGGPPRPLECWTDPEPLHPSAVCDRGDRRPVRRGAAARAATPRREEPELARTTRE